MSTKDVAPGSATEPSHVAPWKLVLGAIGVVFGDIGTSPLYTLQECLTGAHGAKPTPVFALLMRNARSVTDDYAIPLEQVVELGTQVDL